MYQLPPTSDRSLLKDQSALIGPTNIIDKSYLNLKKENTQNSLDSQREQEQKQNERLQVQKIQPSLSRRKLFQQEPIIQQSQAISQEVQKSDFIKLAIKNSMIKRFKNNLLTSSYILPESMKPLLQSDCLRSKNNQNTENDLDHDQPKIFKFLLPSSKFIIYWDLSSIIINFISLWLSFFLLAFNGDQVGQLIISIIIFIYFIADALCDSNRAVLLQGEVISQRSIIISIYIKNQIIEDILYCSLWILIISGYNEFSALNEITTLVIIVIACRKIKRKYNYYIESLYLNGTASNALYDLLTLIISIYFFAHAMACVWHYVGYITSVLDSSWLIKYELINSSVSVRYNYSFYWATMTMVTVGYGDITPQNQVEMLFANILMLLSSCMFAYSMNSIGIIVKNIYDAQIKYKRSLIQINSYMIKNQVDPQIQSRVRNFIKYFIQKEFDENNEDLSKLINNLPDGLRSALNNDIQMKIIQKIKVLKNQFTQSTLDRLALEILQTSYTPGDIIFNQNDQDSKQLYFIESGEIQLVDERSKYIVQTLKPGETFGEHQFFGGGCTKTQAISVGFSLLHQLKRSSALPIIKCNEKDWERFHDIKDNIMLYKKYTALQLACNQCGKCSHLNIDCPQLTYQPNLECKLKKMYYKNEQNQRVKMERQGQKINSLLRVSDIGRSVLNYQQDQMLDKFENLLSRNTFSNTAIDHKSQQFLLEKQLSVDIKKRKSINRTKQLGKSNIFGLEGAPQLEAQNKYPRFLDNLTNLWNYRSEHIDKVKGFQEYMTHDNLQNILKTIERGQKKQKFIICQNDLNLITKYTLNFEIIQLICKIREKFKKNTKKKVMNGIKINQRRLK